MYHAHRYVYGRTQQTGPGFVVTAGGGGGSGQVASDDFNRADATTLGSDWTSQATGLGGNGAIISNTATGDAGVVYEFWSGAGSFTDNQYSQATFPTVAAASGSIETGVGVRQSGSGSAVSNITGYFFGANANVGTTLERRLKILKFIAGTPTEIAAAGSGVVLAAGDILKLEVAFSGGVNTLTGYQNGTPVSLPDTPPVYIDLRLPTSRSYLQADSWERGTREVMRRFVKAGMVAFDIGANMGFHTALLSQIVGPRGLVYAFEPNPILRDNLKRTCHELGNAQVLAFGLSDKRGSFDFFIPIDHTMASLRNWTGLKTDSISIETFTLDSLTGYQNGTPVTGLIGVTDSSIGTGGKPGFMCHNSDRCDNWSAGTP